MTPGLAEKAILKLGRRQLWPRGQPMDPRFLVDRRPIMDKRTPVASMGSCFAANIKGFLRRNGFNYVQTSSAPGSQIGSAAWGTVYNTFCIRQEFARAHGKFQPLETEWPDGNGGLLDPYRKNVGWKNHKQAEEERWRHAEDARRAMEQARVFILTAGLTEIWFHREDGSVFFQVPPKRAFDKDAHSFEASDIEENAGNLADAIYYLRELNPDCQVILTVSPVPLRATFRPMNVVSANAQSKATLLAAVHEMIKPEEGIHYFPSYEIVTVLSRNPYKPDNRHVRPRVLESVMDVFVRSFVR